VIAQQPAQFAVADLCHALGVSRSRYYAWRNSRASADCLTTQVAQVFWRHSRRYGARRIVAELQAQACLIGRRRVSRILREPQLQAIQPKRFVPRTTDSRHAHRMSPNLLGGLEISRPCQVFVRDITYLPLYSGDWAYRATGLDLYSRKIVGWQVAAQMTADLVIGALRQAIVRERPARGLIVHSDRGGQYVDTEFGQLLEANGYEQGMSRAGEI
jgi:putative transposase